MKKLIGKKPKNYIEISRGPRTLKSAAQNANKSDNKVFKVGLEKCATLDVPKVVSTTIGNKVVCLTSTRGRNQLKHTLVVGNTSQYIYKQDSSSKITHKWMCYLLTKSKVPIERIVQKVCFYLDPSYHPNDMIEVISPPFQITSRGYGEFQIKLMIFFREEVQLKPIQIYHHLKLDDKYNGLQALGNETISELWTRDFLTSADIDRINSNHERSSQKTDLVPDNVENHQRSHNHLVDHDYFQFNEISSIPIQKTRKIFLYDDKKREVVKNVFKKDVVKWLKDFTALDTNVPNSTEHFTDNEDIRNPI